MSSKNILIKIFLPSGTFSDFHLGESMEGVQSRRKKTDATATGSAARVASDANIPAAKNCVTCDPCGTVRDENATLTPWKGETTNDQNRTTRIRIVARLSPAPAVARCLPAVAARRPDSSKMLARFQRGKQSVWTPTAKAAGAKRIYLGAEAPRQGAPHLPFLCGKKR